MTDTSSYKPVQAALNVLSIVPLLAGNEMAGLTPGQITKALGLAPSQVGHYLATLQEAGMAEPLADTGRWRLGPKLIQIALAFMRHLDEQERVLQETRQRYSRTPS